jgi:hypothetical protein
MFWSPRYLASKRNVEDYLESNRKSIKSAVLRPGFLYAENDNIKRVTASIMNILHHSDAVFDKIGWQAGKEALSPSRTLPVDLVAKVAVQCAMSPSLIGRTYGVDQIEEISNN